MNNIDNNPKVIGLLNEILKSEFSTIQQYWLHGLTLKHWGFHKIGDLFLEESVEERAHVEKIAKRILQLGGYPKFDAIDAVTLGDNIVEMLNSNLEFEKKIIAQYRNAINEISAQHDYATAEIITQILVEEESHKEWLQSQIRIIAEIGVSQYLVENMHESSKK